MTASYLTRERFDSGRVIERTFGAVGANATVLLITALIFVGLPELGLGWGQAFLDRMGGDATTTILLASLVGLVVGTVGNTLMQGAVTHAVIADLQGRKSSLGESLSAAAGSFWVLLAVGLVSGFAIAFGMILLIVPGVLVLLAWFVVGPVVVAERAGVGQALARSRDLTRNHRFSILLLMILYAVVSGVIAVVVGLALFAVGLVEAGSPGDLIATALVQSVVAMVGATGGAAIYVELRSVKEGGGRDTVAAIFD